MNFVFTEINDRALFISTKHGGHLGFFECQEGHRFFHRGTYTWLDKAIVEYIQAVLKVTAVTALSSATAETCGDESCDRDSDETTPLNSGNEIIARHVEGVIFE